MADKLPDHNLRDPQQLHAKVDVQLDQAAEEVTRQLDGHVDYGTAREAVTDAYQRLSSRAKFTNFLPILAARSARQNLHAGRRGDTTP